MNIKENIIKHYLSNCYFITGTAYAGKSTVCKALAKKYGLYHCEENYNSQTIFEVITLEDQPNLSYFKTMPSWQDFVKRSPQDYEKWVVGNNEELVGFEIMELVHLSRDQKVIVDTNLPLEVLEKIADKDRLVLMLSPPEISSSRFFQREDPEKKFLLEQIRACEDPEGVYKSFLAGIERVNSKAYEVFNQSDYFTIKRGYDDWASEEETLAVIAKHFDLD